jgi:ubiquinone biosynthesis protein COQ9
MSCGILGLVGNSLETAKVFKLEELLEGVYVLSNSFDAFSRMDSLSETFAIITNKITKATIKELLNLLPILD